MTPLINQIGPFNRRNREWRSSWLVLLRFRYNGIDIDGAELVLDEFDRRIELNVKGIQEAKREPQFRVPMSMLDLDHPPTADTYAFRDGRSI